ncbi:hypothetical protein TL16_g04554 [Triparma laevis f. inornata]|uniref:Uncharacterized protein n=1 Tax=Triparma laevis f. inornata TaxID=1714386 RepID=A0A9W7AA73_9STRA|nr:hypothetical protein TL16_g04554 [Triparma laevis f. inornata]
MSKSVATEYHEGHESREMCSKRGAGDEENQYEEGIIATLRTVSTVPATTDQFMHTTEFRRHFVEYVPDDTLMALRLATKPWMRDIENLLRRIIENGGQRGSMIVHDGNDISRWKVQPRKERRKLATRVVFFLNITKVGERACQFADNLVVVDFPEGVESIGDYAFHCCRSLTIVCFPTTLKSIGDRAFGYCSSLDNVDLLHTNLQELGDLAFEDCYELKTMMIPDSLQTLGAYVFNECSKLVPSKINRDDTNAVVAHLRSLQI